MKTILEETNTILELRVNLLNIINNVIKEKKLTQLEVCKILLVNQSRASAIMNYHCQFSLKRLLRFLILLEQRITVVVENKSCAEIGVENL